MVWAKLPADARTANIEGSRTQTHPTVFMYAVPLAAFTWFAAGGGGGQPSIRSTTSGSDLHLLRSGTAEPGGAPECPVREPIRAPSPLSAL